MGSTTATKHQRLKDFVNWFEIPAYDIARATAFYNAIYNMEMETNYNGEYAMSFFPAESGVGGAIVAGPGCFPNETGVLIYLNAGNDLDSVLGRVELAGGRVIMPKTLISDKTGWFALFIDSEGNRLALHEGPARSGSGTVRKEPPPATSSTGGTKAKAAAKKAATPRKKKR